MNKKPLLILIVLLFGSFNGPVLAENQDFSIYLTKDLGYSGIIFQKHSLDKIQLEQEPIISANDIISYDIKTHEIELTQPAYKRVQEINGINHAFVVCIGDERIYGGDLVSLKSSAVFSSIVVQLPGSISPAKPKEDDYPNKSDYKFFKKIYEQQRNQTVELQKGYPTEDFFKGNDPRSDPRIIQALKHSGKIKNKFTAEMIIGFFAAFAIFVIFRIIYRCDT